MRIKILPPSFGMPLIHLSQARARLRDRTGIVVPVFLPEGPNLELGRELVSATVREFAALVSDPQRVCVSVDGSPSGAELAGALQQELGVSVELSELNAGKLAGARRGARALLRDPTLSLIAVVDQDGDHFANEILTLLRAGLHAEAEAKTDRVMVLGARRSLHHPMGFARGELEDLADRVLLDALQYHAAQSGQPLRLQFASLQNEVPDFHSGYKVFTRASAEDVFMPEPDDCGLGSDACYRHAVEAFMSVEALSRGADLVQVMRTTANEQPISIFAQLDAARLTADMILWPCLRLGVPEAFAVQWMHNHMPRIRMGTLVPDGRALLHAVYDAVVEGYGAARDRPGRGPALI